MGLEYLLMLKEVNIAVNGTKIKCKEEVLFTMQMDKSLMKGNGKMINFMGMEYFIMKFQLIFLNNMTINLFI